MSLLLDTLFATIALGHLAVDILNGQRAVLLTYLSVPLGLSNTALSLVSTMYVISGAMIQPVFGHLADRIGPRWLVAGGVLWMGVFFSLAVVTPGSLALVLLVVASLGSAAFHPAGAMQATLRGRDLLKGRETTATSLFFMAGQLGHFIGPIMTGFILASYKIPGLFIVPIVSIPVGFALLHQLRANQPHPKPDQTHRSNRAQVSLIFIVILALVAALQSWAQSNMVNLIPKYIKDLGQSATIYGSMAGLFMGGSAIGNVFGGYFGDRYSKRFIAAGVLFLSSIPIYIASLIGWSWWLYLLIPLAGAFTGAVHSIMVVFAQRIIPGGMALASGLALGFIFSSGALGLLFSGHLAELYGFPFVLTMTTAMVLIASPLALLLKEPGLKNIQNHE